MFPLCRTCAEIMQKSPCAHNDDERAIVGTWVSEELKLAKKKGYRFTNVSSFFLYILYILIVFFLILYKVFFFYRYTKFIILRQPLTPCLDLT